MVIASCGHDITDSESVSLKIMDFTTDWNKEEVVRCVRSGLYCVKCVNEYEGYGVVLHNETEEECWLSGENVVSNY